MTASIAVDTAPPEIVEERRPVPAWRAVLRSWEGRFGITLLVMVLFVIIFGRYFTPYPPNAIAVGGPTTGPSSAHLLGTDDLGRDTLSRMLVGGTVIILIPLLAATLGLLLGGSLGMLGAYKGGYLDALIARTFDLVLAVPPLLVVLIAVASLGNSTGVLVLAVVAVWIPRQGRLVRGATQAHVASEFVDAAKARGERTIAILLREVLPNIASPTLADYALRITQGVIYVATLNYLGLGVQPPTADWGAMVAQGQTFIAVDPIATLAPAAAIALLSISINFIADSMTRHVTHDSAETIPL